MDTLVSIVLEEKGHTVYTIPPHALVYDCVVKMQELNISALVVTHEKSILGIVSQHDVIQKIIARKCDPMKTLVADIMTTDVTTIEPSVSMGAALHIVNKKGFHHLPVVENNNLVGMISIGDLMKWALESQKQEIDSLTDYITGKK